MAWVSSSQKRSDFSGPQQGDVATLLSIRVVFGRSQRSEVFKDTNLYDRVCDSGTYCYDREAWG